jgi:rRNA maturation endonuclease Nob1
MAFRSRCRHCHEVFSSLMNPATPCPHCGKFCNEAKEGEAPLAKDVLSLFGTALAIFLAIGVVVLLLVR